MVSRAFTVIELLVALAVAGVLFTLAVPAFQDLLARHHAASRVNAVSGILRFARQTAITDRRWITLCPARGDACIAANAWHDGIMVFEDDDRDGSRQSDERIVAWLSAMDEGETLEWRSFRRKRYLQFRPRGYTNWQNGSFHYCPASRDPVYGKVLIVNIQGRSTPSVDSDGDGIDEKANGQPLSC